MNDQFDPFAQGLAEPTEAQSKASEKEFDPFAEGMAEPEKQKPSIMESISQVNKAMKELAPTPMENLKAAAIGPLGSLYLIAKNPKRFDLSVEAGIPLIGQVLTTEFTPAVQSAVGAVTSAIGNVLAQSRRMLMGEQDEFRKGEVAQASALGAIPIVGPAKAAAAMARPGIAAAKTAVKTSAAMAGAGAVGEVARSVIDEGELPSKDAILVNSIIPGGFALSTAPISILGSRAVGIAKGIAYRAKELPEGVRPTIGMLRRDLARAEQRIATLDPNSEAARNIQRSYEDFDAMVGTKTIKPQEPSVVMEEVSPLLKQGTLAQEEISKLSVQAQEAEKAAQAAYDDWKSASLAESAAKQEIAKQAGEAAFAEQLNSVTENAIAMAQERAIGKNPVVLDAVSARNLAVEHYAKPLDAAFKNLWERSYSQFEAEARDFATAPIERVVENIRAKNRAISPSGEGALKSIESLFPGGKASLKELRMTRDNLFRRTKGGAMSDEEKGILLDMAAGIKDLIDEQAPDVLGKTRAEELRQLNKDYARYRQVMDADGVDSLFAKHPRDEAIEKVTNSMLSGKGTQADEFKNLMAVAEYMQEFNPNLGASARDEFRNIVRGNILMRSADWDASAQTWMVDPDKLAKNLKKLNPESGSLEVLGLGNKTIVSDLDRLVQKYPEASKMTADQWQAMFASPSFRESLSRDGGFDLAIHKAMAQSHAENLMRDSAYASQVQDVATAKALRDKAYNTISEVGGNLDKAKERYQQIISDPDLRILDNPDISADGVKQLVDSLKNRNTLSNAKIAEFMSALDSKNPKAALWVREHFIADFLGDFHEQSPLFFRHKPSRVSTEHLAKLKDLDVPEIDAKWERMKSVVTPEQYAALDDAITGAVVMNEYEREFSRPIITGGKQVGAVGQKKTLIDVVENAIIRGRYWLAAREFSGREEALRVAARIKAKGVVRSQAGVASQAAAKQAAVSDDRAFDEEKKKAGPSLDRLREATRIDLSEEAPPSQ